MKKRLLFYLVFLVLLCTGFYLFIPNKPVVSVQVDISVRSNVLNRYLADTAKWYLWWPGNPDSGHSEIRLQYEGYRYRVSDATPGHIAVQISNNNFSAGSLMQPILFTPDSVSLYWKAVVPTGWNPVRKINRYLHARKISRSMTGILKSMKAFLENPENMYGFPIKEITVKDTLLITARQVTESYPATDSIYRLINRLKHYAATLGAEETNHPMLHIEKSAQQQFVIQVALPVNKALPSTNTIFLKRMVPGNILFTEVRGGPVSISRAFVSLENYMRDHYRTSPAIPFESLVTNRLQQSDTAEWITRIYYPVY